MSDLHFPLSVFLLPVFPLHVPYFIDGSDVVAAIKAIIARIKALFLHNCFPPECFLSYYISAFKPDGESFFLFFCSSTGFIKKNILSAS